MLPLWLVFMEKVSLTGKVWENVMIPQDHLEMLLGNHRSCWKGIIGQKTWENVMIHWFSQHFNDTFSRVTDQRSGRLQTSFRFHFFIVRCAGGHGSTGCGQNGPLPLSLHRCHFIFTLTWRVLRKNKAFRTLKRSSFLELCCIPDIILRVGDNVKTCGKSLELFLHLSKTV